jgi:Flp pilus assembly protein TadB
VLFGFLLAIRFTGQFKDLTSGQKYVYYATLLSTAVALVLLLAPAAHHRLRFREGDKDFMLRKGNREAIAGSIAIALAFTGALYVVTDLTFNVGTAVAVSVVFFALIIWRWWAYGVYRTLTDR